MTTFADPTLEQTRMEAQTVPEEAYPSYTALRIDEILRVYRYASPKERKELDAELGELSAWFEPEGCDTSMGAESDAAGFGHSGQL